MDKNIKSIKAKGIYLPGNDIDTDRIIPARFLRAVSFDGLTGFAFEDDRKQKLEQGVTHSFDRLEFKDGEILVVESNFGCGSSREHAPQALRRWNKGIKALIGESFAEIFYGNCITLGIPCVTAKKEDITILFDAIEKEPDMEIEIDLEEMTVKFSGKSFKVEMTKGARAQLISGHYDPTDELLLARDAILKTAQTIPYFNF
ncbi:MAG: 3-isopropylmalate dehydratase small subunit [Deltaproteobacteria bacterium]|nr:3-isopropylmalate dehydratase small subunit [Deltaproteobacteria bacterium]